MSGFRGDARGSVSILAAAGLTLAISAAAFAVDLGQVYGESRRLQGIADAAAIAAASDGAAGAAAAATATVAAGAGLATIATQTITGRWTPDPALAPAARFQAGAGAGNAARVTVRGEAPLQFGRFLGLRSVRIVRVATAVRADLAGFSLGSRAAALDDGLANALLGGLTGSHLTLNAWDYRALADADVDLFAFANALRAGVGVTAVSYRDVLATRTTLPVLLRALATALDQSGQAAAATAARAMVAATGAAPTILPAALLDLGPLGSQDRVAPGRAIAVNAYDLVRAATVVAGGGRQTQVTLAGTVPGLSKVTITYAVGEPAVSSPWASVTGTGDVTVRTAQTRLLLDASIGTSGPLALLGVVSVRLPLYVELAAAQARLSAIGCVGATRRVTLSVQPSIGHATIADVGSGDLTAMSTAVVERPATFVDVLGVAKVAGGARVDLSDTGWQTVGFDTDEIAAHTVKTVSSSGSIGAIAQSLIANTTLTATAGPLSLSSPSVAALVRPLLVVAAPVVDTLLGSVLDLLGVRLGQADARIDGLRCGQAALVA